MLSSVLACVPPGPEAGTSVPMQVVYLRGGPRKYQFLQQGSPGTGFSTGRADHIDPPLKHPAASIIIRIKVNLHLQPTWPSMMLSPLTSPLTPPTPCIDTGHLPVPGTPLSLPALGPLPLCGALVYPSGFSGNAPSSEKPSGTALFHNPRPTHHLLSHQSVF